MWQIDDVGTPMSQALSEMVARSGKTAADVARELGRNHATVWRWLNGARDPTFEDVARMAEICGKRLVLRFTDGQALADRLALVEPQLDERSRQILEVVLQSAEQEAQRRASQEAG